MSIQIGQQAPNFSVLSTDRTPVTLDQYKGKNLLLLFFPLAFTGTCTAELCSTRDNIGVYEDANAEVLAVSVDSNASLKVFKEQNQFNFTLASDFNKTASKAYDAFYDDFFGLHGVAKRSAFVIDKEGVIRYAEVLDNAGELPNFDAIQSTIASL